MIRFLLDECVSGAVGTAVADWNAGPTNLPVDVLPVGQPPDLSRGTKDPDLPRWAERNGRWW